MNQDSNAAATETVYRESAAVGGMQQALWKKKQFWKCFIVKTQLLSKICVPNMNMQSKYVGCWS